MKKLIIFVMLMSYIINLYGQVFEDFCGTDCSLKSTTISPVNYSDISNEPIKYVRVYLIFFRLNDGTGGFQENNSEHQQYINDIINYSNYYMSNISSDYDPICYNGNQGVIYDSKIRFDFTKFYINNSLAWNNSSTALNSVRDSLLATSVYPAICMFFTEASSPYQNIVVNQNCPITHNIPNISYSYLPTTSFSEKLIVNMRGIFLKYYWMMHCVVGNSNWGSPNETTVYNWLKSGRIEAHELCHSLNLGDIHKTNCDCDQHLMMHNSCGYGNFLSPAEINDMHEALSLNSSRKYVVETVFSNNPIQISSNSIWPQSVRIYRGIVHNGGTFEIGNELIMPSETDLMATGYANLLLNGANIHTPHTNSLLDFKMTLYSNTTMSNNTTISNCNVELTDNASLTVNNGTINLGTNGTFSMSLGATFFMTQGTIK